MIWRRRNGNFRCFSQTRLSSIRFPIGIRDALHFQLDYWIFKEEKLTYPDGGYTMFSFGGMNETRARQPYVHVVRHKHVAFCPFQRCDCFDLAQFFRMHLASFMQICLHFFSFCRFVVKATSNGIFHSEIPLFLIFDIVLSFLEDLERKFAKACDRPEMNWGFSQRIITFWRPLEGS